MAHGPKSPLERAHQAKQARDPEWEITEVTRGHRQLETAPWAPSRVGDHLVVTHEPHGDEPLWTETYEVIASEGGPGDTQTELRLTGHTAPHDGDAGWFGGPPEMWDTDAIEIAWMEAGPDLLTLLRGGYVVHQGRYAVLPARDVDAIAAASKYVKHGTTSMGGSFIKCTCPKEPCGGVADPKLGCPEHDQKPVQLWHWAAECPAKEA